MFLSDIFDTTVTVLSEGKRAAIFCFGLLSSEVCWLYLDLSWSFGSGHIGSEKRTGIKRQYFPVYIFSGCRFCSINYTSFPESHVIWLHHSTTLSPETWVFKINVFLFTQIRIPILMWHPFRKEKFTRNISRAWPLLLLNLTRRKHDI